MKALKSKRSEALERTKSLFELRANEESALEEIEVFAESVEAAESSAKKVETEAVDGLKLFLLQGASRLNPFSFVILSLLSAGLLAFASTKLFSLWFTPLFFFFGLTLPWAYIEGKVRQRAVRFAEDYPTMLLAAASSIKVGLSAYQALERATRLLEKDSLVREEVRILLEKIQRGTHRSVAISEFARSIRQPDLELFRSAFLLVLENGGRFSPTLMRLAAVSNNRAQLIRSAAVSTASMRMTANVLIVVAPVLVLLLAARTSNYWQTFFHHPVANFLASSGIIIIVCCYGLLRHMSNFKP